MLCLCCPQGNGVWWSHASIAVNANSGCEAASGHHYKADSAGFWAVPERGWHTICVLSGTQLTTDSSLSCHRNGPCSKHDVPSHFFITAVWFMLWSWQQMHLQTCMPWRLEHLCTVLLHMLTQKQRWQRMSFLQCGQCWGSLASPPRPGNRSWQKYHVCCGCHSIMLYSHCRISVLNACMCRLICIGVFLGDSRGESAFGVFKFCASYLTTLFSSLLP